MSEKKGNGAQAAKAGAEVFTKGYDQMFVATKEQVEKFLPNAVKGLDEMSKFGKENMDAAVKASTIAAKGFEAIGKEVTEYNKKAFEASVANAKALMGVKTVQEALELQTGFARSSFDDFVSKGTKISELSVKVAQDAVEPVNARFAEAVEKLVKSPVA
ncbi:MAG: phasin family protein [Alphaproteobacteria bacterium]|nr:phasin family protein [Alphaproteobacteria bacterium]